MSLVLFSTDGCHLCEQAIGMFYYAKQHKLIAEDIQLKIVDIVDDPLLVERYGERIPVIKLNDKELGWPFELEQLTAWLAADPIAK
ncbi:MAG: glutaredoxin family protein [Kangiellaceae bacterium]|jgi:hypothetical protein|nr:glutaredoxin family protein [Kangiellaceae bacterium]